MLRTLDKTTLRQLAHELEYAEILYENKFITAEDLLARQESIADRVPLVNLRGLFWWSIKIENKTQKKNRANQENSQRQ